MKKTCAGLFILLVLAVSSDFGTTPERNPTAALSPLNSILDDQGNLKLGAGVTGSFDPAGYSMIAVPGQAPRFVPAGSAPPIPKKLAAGDEYWDDRFFEAGGANNTIVAVAVSGTDVYVGGFFTTVGSITANHIAKWDGTSWSALGTGMDSNVHSLAVSGTDVYAGGEFTTAGGVPAVRIAKWNGTNWSALGSGMNNPVYSLAASGANVYAGGKFTTAGGGGASYIAKWDGANWSALGSGMNNWVYAIAIFGTDVYAGGYFTTAGGNAANYMAKWDGANWSALGSGMDASVRGLAFSGTNLYAVGYFSTAGGNAANKIAKWDGASWSALGTGLNNTVWALGVSGSDIYAGGQFTTAGGNAANRAAKWDGTSWSALGTGTNNIVWALGVSGSDIYTGGEFTTAGGNGANRIAKWNGSSWSSVGAFGGALNAQIRALAVCGTDVYAGGDFTIAGGTSANYIAKWNGSSWSALGTGMNNSVYALAVSGTDVYAGGTFTTAGGVSANRVAKWDGSSWSALGTGMNDAVYVLAVSGTDVYAGGGFTSAGGVAANRIAKWDGTGWSALGTGMDAVVGALAISGSDVYAGGSFLTAGGVPANRIAKWNGSSWVALGDGLDSSVSALAFSGTELYVGGWFWNAGGVSAKYIAKWNGTTWSALGSGVSDPVLAVAVSGNNIYAAGRFTSPGSYIARWDGSSWSALGSGTNNWIFALAASGGNAYAGGQFTTAGGKTSQYFAHYSSPFPAVVTTAVSGISYTTATSGGNVTSDGGSTITARGVCWSTSANPTTVDSHTTNGAGTGEYASSLTGLTPGATHHVRAYATNVTGTSYGEDLSFASLALTAPTVTTTAGVSDIGYTTATSGGNVTSDGGSAVTARGVCWSTALNPTTDDSKTSNGAGTGEYTSSLTGLTAGELYHIRAYATNGVGTSYGADRSFSTTGPAAPTVTTADPIGSITAFTAAGGGNVTADCGSAVTARGVCWSTSADPTTADNKSSNGTGTGAFTSVLNSLTPGATFHVRAYATNGVGTSYGADVSFAAAAKGLYNIYHVFEGAPGDGRFPVQAADLVTDGTTLYGMTYEGGANNFGTIFKIGTDGTGYALLRSFAGGAGDGKYPIGSLVLNGTTLYGLTNRGGTGDGGTIFKMETNGTGFTILHSFAGGGADGQYPRGSLALGGATLYGMTVQGGASNVGTVFKIATSGAGFALLHTFTYGADDGNEPYGSLLVDGATLYGMTKAGPGGVNPGGTIFKVATTGTDFELLHSFGGGASDGKEPYGSLVLNGTTLFGLTIGGGTNNSGTIFKIENDGSGFGLLHEFPASGSDGVQPYGSLVLNGTTFYGLTSGGGGLFGGTIFKIGMDGTGHETLHTFAGGGADGRTPQGSLVLSGGTLYGMTTSGGSPNYGVIFSQASFPVVTTTEVTGIGYTGATSGGDVTSEGGDPVTARGVCWSAAADPTTADSKTTDGAGTGAYASSITGLTPGATYHVRAYATNAVGMAYGEDVSFAATSLAVPTVTTTAVTGVTSTGASSGGNVTADGGASVTARGVCWKHSANPTIANSKTTDGSGLGAYTSPMTGLDPGSTYHVRAYATNTVGTAYGEDLVFYTPAVLPTVTTTAVSGITQTGASSGGNVTGDGGTSVTGRGVCWSTMANPTTADSKTTDGTGSGTFTSSITGLAAGTPYHVRAYATNSAGTGYGDDVSFTTSAPPAGKKNDFNGDGQDDILWRYHAAGGYNSVWFMAAGSAASPSQAPSSDTRVEMKGRAPLYADARQAGDGSGPERAFLNPREAMSSSFGEGLSIGTFTSPRHVGFDALENGTFATPLISLPDPIAAFVSEGAANPQASPVRILGGADISAVSDLDWKIVGTGDFNGDGKTDLLWRYNGTGGYLCVWYLNGTTVLGGADLPSVADLSWQVAGTGDFNGDGKVDILWRYQGAGGYACVWFMNGKSVMGGADLPSVNDLAWQITGLGDFNADGKTDILWRYQGAGGYLCVWFLNGTAVAGGVDLPSVNDLTWQVQETADFNGDGKMDLIWRYYGAGGYNCVWFLNGTTLMGGQDIASVADLLWKIVSR